MKFTNKKLLAVISCLLVVSTIIGIYTYAKYTSLEEISGDVTLEEFYSAAKLHYTKDGVDYEVQVKSGDSNENIQYIELTPEEFETLKVDISYFGDAKVYSRFRLDCSWYHQIDLDGETVDELIPHEYPTYTYDSDILYDNTAKDGWIYFKNILPEEETDDEIVYENVLSIDDPGTDVDDLNEDTHESQRVRITVTIDCVQYNRVKQLWKISSLPWE